MKDNDQIIDMRGEGDGRKDPAQRGDKEKRSRRICRALGIAAMDEIRKKKLAKASFTAKADSPEQAGRLRRLAAEALDAGGRVYAIRDRQKNCVCWGILTRREDRREGKKVLRHYELTALEAADGYADRLASFEKDIIMIIQERMIVTSDAQNARINGYVYYPAMPAFWRMPAGNLWFAIAMGLIFARLADNPAFGFAMFALFICGGREEKPRKVIGDGGESGDDAGTSGQ